MILFHMKHSEQHTMGTHAAYVGVPLADLSAKARGDVLEGVVRRVLERQAGEAATDAVAGATVAGRKRGRNSAPYDFDLSGRRVEVKSAQLRWDTASRRWQAAWQHIKPDEHDDLYLALYTPFGVYIHLHNGVHGVSTHGKQQAANGGSVNVYGSRSEPSSLPAVPKSLHRALGQLLGSFSIGHDEPVAWKPQLFSPPQPSL